MMAEFVAKFACALMVAISTGRCAYALLVLCVVNLQLLLLAVVFGIVVLTILEIITIACLIAGPGLMTFCVHSCADL